MVQSVFARGEMVAAHANLRVQEGAQGGASHKRSLDEPAVVVRHLESLGRSLRWHGGLSADAILTDAGPVFVDINPRLVEPGNAWRSGVDLVGALLDVARGSVPEIQSPGRPGVATHQMLLAVLGAVAQGRGRRGLALEIRAALTHVGLYRGSAEELTPVRGDPRRGGASHKRSLDEPAVVVRHLESLGRSLPWHGGPRGHATRPGGQLTPLPEGSTVLAPPAGHTPHPRRPRPRRPRGSQFPGVPARSRRHSRPRRRAAAGPGRPGIGAGVRSRVGEAEVGGSAQVDLTVPACLPCLNAPFHVGCIEAVPLIVAAPDPGRGHVAAETAIGGAHGRVSAVAGLKGLPGHLLAQGRPEAAAGHTGR